MNISSLKKFFNVHEYHDEKYLDILQYKCDKSTNLKQYRSMTDMFSDFEKEDIKSSLDIPDFVDIPYSDSGRNADRPLAYGEYFSNLKRPFTLSSANSSDKGGVNLKNYPEALGLIDFQIEFFKVLISECDYLTYAPLFVDLYDNKKYIDKKLFCLCECVVNQLTPKSVISYSLRTFIRSFDNYMEEVMSDGKFDSNCLKVLQLFGKVLLIILDEYCDEEDHNLPTDVYTYISYFISNYLYSNINETSSEAMHFAKRGLFVQSPFLRQDAFSNLGMMAIINNDLQLANDVYYSWISMDAVGEVGKLTSAPVKWSKNENEWRNTDVGSWLVARMYGNLAHVCIRIGDTYDRTSETRTQFYKLAEDYILYAKKHNPNNGIFSYTYGNLLSDRVVYDLGKSNLVNKCISEKNRAYDEYKIYKKLAFNDGDYSEMLCSNRMCCNILRQLLFFELYKSDSKVCENKSIKSLYNKLSDQVASYYEIDGQGPRDLEFEEELRVRNELSTLMSFSDKTITDDFVYHITVLVLSITECIETIKSWLHRSEYLTTVYDSRVDGIKGERVNYNDIAYYTTLKTIAHVFDDLYVDDGIIKQDTDGKVQDTKNCLTVMNSKYMNDPNEGIVLIEELLKNLKKNSLFSGKKAKTILKEINDEQFVFLKSFTEQVDKLVMWNRYANDYSGDGNNSNGCCVIVDSESFVSKPDFTVHGSILSPLNNSDDYTLYRVVYISSDGSIERDNNPGINDNVIYLYEKLKKWIIKLNQLMTKYKKDYPCDDYKLIKRVEDVLKDSLQDIIYLFKNTDYSDEHESRLILFRDSKTQRDIRIISGNPPLLALNPFFQIRIKKIIFGPNVRDVEKWRPYFQYQLNKMWEKCGSKPNVAITGDDSYIIDKSSIEYWT